MDLPQMADLVAAGQDLLRMANLAVADQGLLRTAGLGVHHQMGRLGRIVLPVPAREFQSFVQMGILAVYTSRSIPFRKYPYTICTGWAGVIIMLKETQMLWLQGRLE
ncbi:hypothetical protein SAMN05216353_16017 [Halobacillus alkaliphilus]|uniref:Uncharacterized protein n=1 Tax=Halobacillus alkaliphilus TaxID=396056 RepID=A0A1I2T311_9BACI|nr:hypothetical protein SAMN05216353_16017 [Halobacillus alkaliphilus]